MTAVAVDLATVVTEAHAVLHVAMELPAPQSPEVEAAIVSLGSALEDYAEIHGNRLPLEWVYPELADEPDPGEAKRAALSKAADEAAAYADDLVRAMAGITAGGDAGTEDEMAIPGVGK